MEPQPSSVGQPEDEHWDELLAREDAQRVMEQLAREALAEEQAGRTVEMAFDEDGNLIDLSPEDSFEQGWQEAMQGDVHPSEELWIDVE